MKKWRILVLLLSAVVLTFSYAAGETEGRAEPPVVSVMTHWWNEPGVGDWLREAGELFKTENPDIEFQPLAIPFDQMISQEFSKLPTDTPPAVMYAWTNIVSFIATGLLTDLMPFARAAGIPERYAKSTLDIAMDAEGHLYGMPMQASCEAFVINKSLFDAKGVKIPTTMEELYTAAKALTDTKNGTYGIGLLTIPAGGRMFTRVYGFTRAFGGNIFEAGKPKLDSQEVVNAMRFYKRFVTEGLTPKGVDESVLREMFANGKIAMMIDVPVLVNITRERNQNTYSNIVVTTHPSKDHIGTALSIAYFFIPKNYKNTEAAWAWLELLARPEVIDRFMMLTKMTHASKKPVPNELLKENPWMDGYAEQIQYSEVFTTEGLEAYYTEFRQLVSPYLEEALFPGKSIEEVLGRAQKDLLNWASSKK